jgi:hypothetical protein
MHAPPPNGNSNEAIIPPSNEAALHVTSALAAKPHAATSRPDGPTKNTPRQSVTKSTCTFDGKHALSTSFTGRHLCSANN